MKIRINKRGTLKINGKWKECPYTAKLIPDTISGIDSWDGRVCGDWCALFGEPIPGRREVDRVVQDATWLILCKGYWLCKKSDFLDEREVANDQTP